MARISKQNQYSYTVAHREQGEVTEGRYSGRIRLKLSALALVSIGLNACSLMPFSWEEEHKPTLPDLVRFDLINTERSPSEQGQTTHHSDQDTLVVDSDSDSQDPGADTEAAHPSNGLVVQSDETEHKESLGEEASPQAGTKVVSTKIASTKIASTKDTATKEIDAKGTETKDGFSRDVVANEVVANEIVANDVVVNEIVAKEADTKGLVEKHLAENNEAFKHFESEKHQNGLKKEVAKGSELENDVVSDSADIVAAEQDEVDSTITSSMVEHESDQAASTVSMVSLDTSSEKEVAVLAIADNDSVMPQSPTREQSRPFGHRYLVPLIEDAAVHEQIDETQVSEEKAVLDADAVNMINQLNREQPTAAILIAQQVEGNAMVEQPILASTPDKKVKKKRPYRVSPRDYSEVETHSVLPWNASNDSARDICQLSTPTVQIFQHDYASQVWLEVVNDKIVVNSTMNLDARLPGVGIQPDNGAFRRFSSANSDVSLVWSNKLSKVLEQNDYLLVVLGGNELGKKKHVTNLGLKELKERYPGYKNCMQQVASKKKVRAHAGNVASVNSKLP